VFAFGRLFGALCSGERADSLLLAGSSVVLRPENNVTFGAFAPLRLCVIKLFSVCCGEYLRQSFFLEKKSLIKLRKALLVTSF